MTDRNASSRLGSAGAGFLLVCVVACGGPSAPVVPAGDEAVASFSGGHVLRSEFDRYPTENLSAAQAGATAASSDWRLRVVDEIAVRKLLAMEAPETNLELAAAIDNARARVIRDAAYLVFGLGDVTVNIEELRQLYDSHVGDFRDQEKLRLQQIYIRAEAAELPEAERKAARARLEAIRQEILAGADFTALARRHSDSATAHSGGWILLKRDANVHPQVLEEVWDQELDGVSEVVATPVGFHLFKLKERIPPIERTFAEVAEFVRQRAVAEKRKARERAFVDATGSCYGLFKDYDALLDPFIENSRPLIYFYDGVFTFADLLGILPGRIFEELYNHYLPNVEEILDGAVLERLLVREAERIELEKEEVVARAIQETTDEVRAGFALQLRLSDKMDAIDKDELHEFYWQNEQRFQTLRKTYLSVIMLKNEGESMFQTLKQGEALADRVRAGEDFGALARKYSKHYSASLNGMMEDLSESDISAYLQSSAKFRRMLKNLEEGEIEVMVAECYAANQLRYIQTGVVVVRKDKVYEPRQGSYELVEELVRLSYLRRHYSELVAEVRRGVLEDADLTVDLDALPPL